MAQNINVRVHMPNTDEDKEILQNKLAECLADGIINMIGKAQAHSRLTLYDGLMENIKSGVYFQNRS